MLFPETFCTVIETSVSFILPVILGSNSRNGYLLWKQSDGPQLETVREHGGCRRPFQYHGFTGVDCGIALDGWLLVWNALPWYVLGDLHGCKIKYTIHFASGSSELYEWEADAETPKWNEATKASESHLEKMDEKVGTRTRVVWASYTYLTIRSCRVSWAIHQRRHDSSASDMIRLQCGFPWEALIDL